MITKIKELIINDWKSNKKKDKIFKNNFSINFSIFLCVVILFSSYLFFHEEMLINNELIKYYIDYCSSIFPSIESRAIIAKESNLYVFAKYQAGLSIILLLIVFIILTVSISKIYLCSLEIIKYKKLDYINHTIKKNKSFTSITLYIVYIISLIFLINVFFYANYNSESILKSINFLFTTKIGILIYSFVFSITSGFLLSVIVVETIAKIYNLSLKFRGR